MVLLSPAELLEFIRAALENNVDSLQQKLALWTAAVALGLLWEYGAEWAKISCEKLDRERAKRVPPTEEHRQEAQKRFKWIPGFLVLGAIAVTAGVAGELLVEAEAASAEARLRNFNNSEDLQQRRDIADARERAANFESKIAEFNARAKTAELELAKFKTPRHLGSGQRRRIVLALNKFPKFFFVNWASLDSESAGFKQEIESMLVSEAGWQCVNPTSSYPVIFSGVMIQIDSTDEPVLGPVAIALVKALTSEGVAAKMEINPNHEKRKAVLHVVIGEKPK